MRAAVCQMNAGGADVERNVETAVRLLEEAAEGGADLATLPELWLLRVASPDARARRPRPRRADRTISPSRGRSDEGLGGENPEVDEDGRVFNTSCLFDRDGELVAGYRKIHLFDVDLPGQPPLRESAAFAEGSELVAHQTDLGRVGLSICYDLRFPELYRGLMALGAEIMLVPAAFTRATGEAHWEILLRARAIEDQCFVVAPAQWGAWGPPEDGRRTHGHSMIVDPWGAVLAEAPGDGDGVWFADLDPAELRRVRTVLPALAHRRLGSIC